MRFSSPLLRVSEFSTLMMSGRLWSALFLSFSIVATSMTDVNAAGLRKYAGIVMDAKTGKILYARNADARRFPASVTKVMTLYILFEALESGRLKMSSRLKVSARAASQQPSKIYLKPGSTITVRDAIKALITKSANDVASVVAENISGTEWAFANKMTRTARRLGMKNTTYKNASGLPNSKQITTVRDQVRLGAAMLQHFPQYYDLFKTRKFKYRGKTYTNHNRLLGEYGIDGLKTGYTRASGFNLLTSSRSKGRHVVIAAFGFKSSANRNAHVRELARKYRHKGRAGAYRTAALIQKPTTGGRKVAAPGVSKKLALPLRIVTRPGSTQTLNAPIRVANAPKKLPVRDKNTTIDRHFANINTPIKVANAPKKLPVRDKNTTIGRHFANIVDVNYPVTTARPLRQPLQIAQTDVAFSNPLALQQAQIQQKPHDLLDLQSASSIRLAFLGTPHDLLANQQAMMSEPIFDQTVQNLSSNLIAHQTQKLSPKPFFGPTSSYQGSGAVNRLTTHSTDRLTHNNVQDSGRWIVQVGATPTKQGAYSLFEKTKAHLGVSVSPYEAYVEPTQRKGQQFFRARYAGFAHKQDANRICQSMKSNGLSCLVVTTR